MEHLTANWGLSIVEMYKCTYKLFCRKQLCQPSVAFATTLPQKLILSALQQLTLHKLEELAHLRAESKPSWSAESTTYTIACTPRQ